MLYKRKKVRGQGRASFLLKLPPCEILRFSVFWIFQRTLVAPSLAPNLVASALQLTWLLRIDIDSKQLADVARFRDALGPGTLPLLSALFQEALNPAEGGSAF